MTKLYGACTLLFVSVILLSTPASPDGGGQPLTNADVIKMVDAGLGENLIIQKVLAEPAEFDVGSDQLIALKEAGASESVLSAMVTRMSRPAASAASPASTGSVIRDGTEVKVRLAKEMSSATAQVGDEVPFEVVEDVVVDGTTVISRGASGRGAVVRAKKKRGFGRRGRLDFTIDAVKSVGGQNVALRTTKTMKGQDSYSKAGVVTLLTGPFGIFVKGKDIEIPEGTEYTIFIAGDRTIP